MNCIQNYLCYTFSGSDPQNHSLARECQAHMKLTQKIQNKRSLRSGLCVSKNAYSWHVETIKIPLKVTKNIYRKYATAAIFN